MARYVSFRTAAFLEELVERDWQVPNALPSGVENCIRDSGRRASEQAVRAALNSLASTTVMDFLKPLSRAVVSDAQWLRRAKYATVLWGAILFGVALIARHWGSVLQAGLSIASIIYGSLLGVFLLGLLTKRVGEIAAMCAMASGLVLMLYIRFFTPIAFTWYVLIGSSATFALGLALSFLLREKQSASWAEVGPAKV